MQTTEPKPGKPWRKCRHCPWGKRLHQKLIICMFPECVRRGEQSAEEKNIIVKMEPQTVKLFAVVLQS